MQDGNVDRIMFDVDSPGGLVMGCFELTDKIFAMRGTKPMTAFVEGGGYSAAFAIASAADEIVMTRMSGVGSVGVVTTLMDMSKMLEKAGVKITQVFAGKHKVDGNPFEPLPEDVKMRIQSRIDRTYGIFVDTVARNRGISSDSVRSTEALTFTVEEAIENKFADRMDTDVDTDQNEVGITPVANDGEDSMAKPSETPKTTATAKPADTTTAEAPDNTAALAAARADGAAAERTRFSAVLASDNYAGREDLAQHLLGNTDMTAEAIDATLATSAPKVAETTEAKETEVTPEATTETPGAEFNAAMATTDNPEVTTADTPEPKTKVEKNQAALAAARNALGE